jgi:hypothetical protein
LSQVLCKYDFFVWHEYAYNSEIVRNVTMGPFYHAWLPKANIYYANQGLRQVVELFLYPFIKNDNVASGILGSGDQDGQLILKHVEVPSNF